MFHHIYYLSHMVYLDHLLFIYHKYAASRFGGLGYGTILLALVPCSSLGPASVVATYRMERKWCPRFDYVRVTL